MRWRSRIVSCCAAVISHRGALPCPAPRRGPKNQPICGSQAIGVTFEDVGTDGVDAGAVARPSRVAVRPDSRAQPVLDQDPPGIPETSDGADHWARSPGRTTAAAGAWPPANASVIHPHAVRLTSTGDFAVTGLTQVAPRTLATPAPRMCSS